MRFFLSAWVLIALGLATPLTHAMEGQVFAKDGKPIAGAMITLSTGEVSETAYSDIHGHFVLSTRYKTGQLRIRHPQFQDTRLQWTDTRVLKFKLQPHRSLEDAYPTFPASLALEKLHWNNTDLKQEFISQCMFCHQQGNFLTRVPRPLETWESILDRMEGMGSLLTWEARKNFPRQLYHQWDGKPHEVNWSIIYPDDLSRTHITEWELGDGRSYIHDIVETRNGKIYAVDMSLDQLISLNPRTHEIKTWTLPESHLPLGGLMSGAHHPLGTLEAHHGPHSLQEASDGKLWITASLSTRLLSFDPKTNRFEQFRIPRGMYPHTLRLDPGGIIWFTLALSNQVGRFDPHTRRFQIIDLPCDNWVEWISAKWVRGILKISSFFPQKNYHVSLSTHRLTGLGARILTLPYGIDVSPTDGSIWYSKLYAGKIGRIDPTTLAITEIKTPLGGPRRLRFSRKTGMLWIPAFTDNALMRFDPRRSEFKIYPLPTLSPGSFETPYALNIHPKTDEVWITGGASDRLIRFNPTQETFQSYPLPTRVTFMREIVFLNEQRACSSYSNLPASSIEGGRPKIVCL